MTALEALDTPQAIEELGPWFHNLRLPDGTETAPDHPLQDFPGRVWRTIARHIPQDLEGWTVLDIGCNAGYYSFELARRGADVTGIDHDPHYLRQARWAAGRYGLENVRFEQMQVYDLARDDRTFDLVWFMGVMYHLRYPLLGLDIASRRTRRAMLFQTMTLPGDEVVELPEDFGLDERERMLAPGWPMMAFVERRLAEDPTNWWAPNHACVESMLRSCGIGVRTRIMPEVYLCEPLPGRSDEERQRLDDEYRAALGL